MAADWQADGSLLDVIKEKLHNKWLLAAGVVVVLLLLTIISLKAKKQETSQNTSADQIKLPESGFFTPNSNQVYAVGEDRYSGNDISYVKDTFAADTPADTKAQKQVESIIAEKTIVIQEAAKLGYIQIDPKLMDPNKDWPSYNQAFEDAKRAILDHVEQITVEGIYIYFNNDNPPEGMSVARAKSITYNKLKDLREKLLSAEINMQQAADVIRNDASLQTIDEIYQSNAYAVLKGRFKDQLVDPGLTDADNASLWDLSMGDISPVFIGFEKNVGDEQLREAYWVVYKVIDKHGTLPPYRAWLQEKMNQYEAESN